MTYEVTHDDTAQALGSGDVPVLATPRLIAWLEAATVEVARTKVADSQTTVGTAVRVKHRRPTRVGGTVTTKAKLTSGPDEKGRLSFTVSATDGDGATVADGEIDRVIVERMGAFAS
ncbi:thioesterase [Actinomycetospora sp. OC33-EN08]|uniref:Thioesterase n=1 Tax=Actinomycetospora aurantiaca TaxID=3129233 RepID=A0ABU8MI53_9PSEU